MKEAAWLRHHADLSQTDHGEDEKNALYMLNGIDEIGLLQI